MVLGSVEAVNRSLSERVRFNRAVLRNKYWYLPVDNIGHEDFQPVGRGRRSSDLCGKWLSFLVCKHTELHEGVFVGGVDCTGKVLVRHQHLWCNRSSCPVCFIHGWSVREARRMEGRLAEGSRRGFGEVEHITVSISPEDRGLPEEVMREKARKALLVRGVVGGCMIFHAFRGNKERECLEWSPHYHTLGYARGRERCRGCKKVCFRGCGVFVDRNYRCGEKDGYLVKVHGKRKTVLGTAWYQLNHATIRVGLKRFQVVTWFGVVSYSKLKAEKVKAEALCPACHSEMVRSAHWGKRVIVKDVGDPDYVPLFVDDEFDVSGKPNYVDVVGGGFG